jgi:hypothetical protein
MAFAPDAGGAAKAPAKPAPKGKAAPAKPAPKDKAAPAKPAPKDKAAPSKGAVRAGIARALARGLGRWRRNTPLRNLFQAFSFTRSMWAREKDHSLQGARAIARKSQAALDAMTVDAIARALYVLEVEAPSEARSFRQKLGRRVVERFGNKVDTMPDISEQVSFYHELYSVPCRGSVRREGKAWPPHYVCSESAKEPTGDPTPVISLRSEPRLIPPPVDADQKEKDAAKKDAALAAARKRLIAERDRFAVPREEIATGMPTQFCAGGRCFSRYADVAAALYGAGRGSDSLPVFCAPKEKRKSGDDFVWTTSKVECSANWLDTLGGWSPWQRSGEPSPAPEPGVIPPVACFGSPHLVREHMVLPASGQAGQSGFLCRNRIFRVLAKKAERSIEDVNRNIAQMCSEMRFQVWGERYKDINSEYQKWCHGPKGPRDKSKCLPAGAPAAGMEDAPALPFMLLSREELLFFYGHRELYCRADRKGLVHFLDAALHGKWAPTFTCNVARGLLEAGPFEEGVQVCALAPFAGEEPAASGLSAEALKARLHCWKYERPTCEEISNPAFAEQKDSISRSNVFDAFDALREARRTRHPDAWSLFDMKDAEKLASWEEKLAFADTAKDEGTFGVKEFCRFVGNRKKIQCGFDKKSMARFYELHQNEPPEGCSTGVCARGAFQRGYFCGLFSTRELFEGRPYWMCGIDVGIAGRKLLDNARAICVGGSRARGFQSAKGDKSSLQCYERRFRWGETERSEDLIRDFDWGEAIHAAARIDPHYDSWLHGGDQAHDDAKAKNQLKELEAGHKAAAAALKEAAAKDEKELVKWAVDYGHTLGHRTSLRLGLLSSKLGAIAALKRLKFKKTEKFGFAPLGCKSGCVRYEFKPEGKELALSDDKAKALNDLVQEVESGSRPADGKWYQSFRLEATEDGQLRIDPRDLAIALRVHHLHEVLAGARRIVLNHARKYADAVLAGAKRSKRLSRLEVHEKARRAPIPYRYKGNVFCVQDPDSFAPSGRRDYVCASSPLLVAGAVEHRVERRLGRSAKYKKMGELARERQRQRVRAKLKFGWCYGGTEGQPLYGHNPSKALSSKKLSSPFEMDIPRGVIGKPKPRPRLRWLKLGAAERRPLERLARSPGLAPEGGLDVSLIAAIAKKPAGKVAARPAPKPAAVAAALRGLRVALTKRQQQVSNANWLKCTGFQYSDEVWEEADPRREPKKGEKKAEKPPPGPDVGGDSRAAEETSKIMKEVGGLIISVVSIVLPKFGDALKQVQNLANAATEFYDKYVKKFVEIARAVWEAAKGNIEKAKEAVFKISSEIAGAVDEARKKAVNAAKPSPSEAMAQKNKEAEASADQKVKELQAKLKTAEAGVAAVIKASQQGETVPNTGNLLAPLLEDLLKLVSERIMGVIEPNARSLLSKGFKFLRNFLDPIAKSVISALAGIPFVGAGLAALGQVAYSLAMDALENAAGDALMGLVERILSKLLRGVITPVFKAVASKVLEIAAGACQAIMGKHSDACPQKVKFAALPPRDRWLERALACPGRPIFDRKLYRDAVLAERRIRSTAARMRRNVHVYARDLADRYLARFGLSYDRWMAIVGADATPRMVAQAGRIRDALLEEADRIRTRRERARE